MSHYILSWSCSTTWQSTFGLRSETIDGIQTWMYRCLADRHWVSTTQKPTRYNFRHLRFPFSDSHKLDLLRLVRLMFRHYATIGDPITTATIPLERVRKVRIVLVVFWVAIPPRFKIVKFTVVEIIIPAACTFTYCKVSRCL